MGRKTYVDMAVAWPNSDGPIAAAMNEIPKVVFSRTLTTADWADSTFARALNRERLVDEYRLMVQPAALGTGMPIFDDLPASLHLELVESRPFATGAIENVYRPR